MFQSIKNNTLKRRLYKLPGSVFILVLMVLLAVYVPSATAQDSGQNTETATGTQPDDASKKETTDAKPADTEKKEAKKDISDLIQDLNVRGYGKKKREAVSALAASGSKRAAPVLDAMLKQILYYRKKDKKIFIVKKDGSNFLLTDAITGKKAGVGPKNKFKKVKTNNRLRGLLTPIVARLQLLDKDPDVRYQAAINIYKSTKKNTKILAVLNEALQNEKVDSVKQAIIAARAAIVLKNDQPEKEKLEAIKVLLERSDQKAHTHLLIATQRHADGPIKTSALAASESVGKHLKRVGYLQNILFGISLGSILLLAAIGLAITFGVMGVINMAHGEMMMIGAYTAFVVQTVLQSIVPVLQPYSLIISIPAAFVVAGLIGIFMERVIVRFLYKRPLDTLLATWGVSLVLQQGIRTIFDPRNKPVETPNWLQGQIEYSGLTMMTYNRIAIVVVCLIAFMILMYVLRNTFYGLKTRAVTQNRSMAASMGISTKWIDSLTFGLGCGIAGIAGVAFSLFENVTPDLGQKYIILSFLIVVFGGVGNLWGALVGALTLGIFTKLLEPITGAIFAQVLLLIFVILFIQVRPRGLFPQKGRAAES